ncbi:hypothetical protein FACS189421_02040 [Bacteroidia bacterium]|nr:hypothetical protein FACS189421_02040 [Bacteroidia bacterium]GHT48178.1 hypothetical protein FACS189440_11080 [Bacteroidia bacterium]
MKKIIGGWIFLFTVFAVHAQTTEFQPSWAFGLNAGATLSNVSFTPSVPQKMLLQESGGLVARYISEKHFGLQAELNYALRGWKEESDTVTHFNKYARSLAYLELPVMMHFYYDLGKRARFVFNAGPQISYNIGEKELEEEIVTPPNSDPFIPLYYDQKVQRKFDYGLTGGLGIEIRTGIGNFILEGRYYYGLSDIFHNRRIDTFQSSHNQVIGVKLAYLIER